MAARVSTPLVSRMASDVSDPGVPGFRTSGTLGAGDPFAEDPSLQAVETPLWRESFFGFDWLALRTSPVFFGCGVPRGNGEPVILVPGFLASDFSLVEMFQWLGRIGYRAYFSRIGRNADCPDHLQGLLVNTIRRAREESCGQRVKVIGHSLGGMLARSAALDHPDLVETVISLGSPFRDAVRAHPAVIAATEALRQEGRRGGKNTKPSCFSGHCTCDFVKNMFAPAPYETKHFAIYTKNDGVVEWQSCIEEDEELNTEVSSTHIGMAFHPGVYSAIGKLLAVA